MIEVKAIACELPAVRAVPLGRWSLAELRQEVITTGLVDDVSISTIWRWLEEDALKPWRHRSWIFPRDSDFAAKARVVLDLYQRRFRGRRLEPGEFVISADEKTSIQARCRCHPTLPPGVARVMRVEHEYERGGALAYLAAWDVHQARLFGRLEPTTGIAPFGRLVEQVMATEPYASAHRVFWMHLSKRHPCRVPRTSVPMPRPEVAAIAWRLFTREEMPPALRPGAGRRRPGLPALDPGRSGMPRARRFARWSGPARPRHA